MPYARHDVMEQRAPLNPAGLAILAGAPAGIVLFVLLVLVSPLVALIVAVVVWAALSAFVWRSAGGLVLRLAGGRAPDLGSAGPARLDNLLTSVSAAAGVPKPALLVVDDDAPDALVTGRTPREVTFVATTGLLERLDRLQLEAVVAHQLALVRAGGTHGRDVATVVLGVPGTRIAALRRAAEGAVASRHEQALALDAAAIGVTRYPPALLGALEAAAATAPVGGHPALGPLWWVPTDRADLDLRLDHMRELA
jgi:Zn-dependent protease with chaperone function